MEHSFAVDGRFMVFLLVMVLLFVLFGSVLDPGSVILWNYEFFW